MVTNVSGFVVTEVLENGEEVCIYKEMEIFTFWLPVVVVWGKSVCTLEFFGSSYEAFAAKIPGAIYNNY